MLTARSVAAAARQADVGQSTLRRWLREDDNFQNELCQYREEALSHASLLLQQGCAMAVSIMYELIAADAPVPSGKVTLIRTAIEFAFRSAVYLDILDRVRALEKIQRQNQSAGNNPPPSVPSRTQSQTSAPDQPRATDSKQDTSQGRRPQRAIFRRSAHSCPDPINVETYCGGRGVNGGQNFRQSAHTCSIRTPKTTVAQGSAVPPRASGEWSGQAAPSSTPQSARMDKEYALFSPVQPPRNAANQPRKSRRKVAFANRVVKSLRHTAEMQADRAEARTEVRALEFLHFQATAADTPSPSPLQRA